MKALKRRIEQSKGTVKLNQEILKVGMAFLSSGPVWSSPRLLWEGWMWAFLEVLAWRGACPDRVQKEPFTAGFLCCSC